MADRLKVYVTRIGFHELAVAAPNQKAALKAWDVDSDLFAQGEAEVATDSDTVEAGLASPGVVLRRLPGGKDPWTAAEAELPAAPTGGKVRAKPKPSRKALDKAEAALKTIEAEREALEAEQAGEREALEARQRKATKALEARRAGAEAAVEQERKRWDAR